MLNMTHVGRTISQLRKQNDMTQMELAEKLNISFQAVSNWERGTSMPDISKLPELAKLFGVTIDDLLGETSELINHAADNTVEEYLEHNEVTVEQLSEAAPILKPSQVETVFQKTKVVRLAEVAALLPFLDQETIDLLAKKAVESGDDDGLERLVPFISQSLMDDIALTYAKNGVLKEELFPFMSSERLKAVAEQEFEKNGLKNMVTMFPFLDEECLSELAKREFEKNGLKNMVTIAPFLDGECLAELAKRAIAAGDVDALSSIAPFLDGKTLTKYLKEMFS